jgi:hypothetical protein
MVCRTSTVYDLSAWFLQGGTYDRCNLEKPLDLMLIFCRLKAVLQSVTADTSVHIGNTFYCLVFNSQRIRKRYMKVVNHFVLRHEPVLVQRIILGGRKCRKCRSYIELMWTKNNSAILKQSEETNTCALGSLGVNFTRLLDVPIGKWKVTCLKILKGTQ